MDNKTIISILRSTATLLDLHGANPFQIKHYTNAALFLDELGQAFSTLTQEAINQLAGARKSIALIQQIHETGTLARWEELMAATPPGVLEMLKVKGLGPKKVRALWKELGIESTEALLEACQFNQVAQLPGFGPKTQTSILESLLWREQHQAKLHYATALPYAQALQSMLEHRFPDSLISAIGELRRQMEVVEAIELLVGTEQPKLIQDWLNAYEAIEQEVKLSGPFAWRGSFKENSLKLHILFCAPTQFYQQLILQTGSTNHLALALSGGKSLGELILKADNYINEISAYHQAGLPYIPPELREGMVELDWIKAGAPALIARQDLQGVLHNHTTYSDGQHTLEAMAQYCKDLGYQYIGITDHSQSASYAGGLTVSEIQQQQQLIDHLNLALAPFKIFKGIEIDILGDGSLDYPDEVLASFDFTVASIHSNLNMNQQTATERLIKAISNPFTTILGHPTGRLLLKRPGYPIDHQAVIDACAAYGVIIEINANPWRLDLDWRWVHYAIQQNVWLSINPDAHHQDEIHHMLYGVLVGRKGGLTKEHTFNTLSREAVEKHFQARKAAALAQINK